MPKYLILWDAGYGQNHEIVECETQLDADREAYDRWKDDAESQAEYEGVRLTAAVADEFGIDWDDDQ